MRPAILGLLTLLLGFNLTMAFQRFDSRSQTVISEANAIDTAYLRTQLLPEAQRQPARGMIADYVQLRIAANKLDLTQVLMRHRMQQDVQRAQDALWALALEAAR